jgi:hypothetical protein
VPVHLVYGIPSELRDSEELRKFIMLELPEAAASVPEMGITNKLVSVFAPGDLLNYGLGNEIVVMVQGLFSRTKRPGRTAGVLQRFAEAICDCTVKFALANVPNCEMVEVFDPNNPDECFADWRKPA